MKIRDIDRQNLSMLLMRASVLPHLEPAKELKDKLWIHFEWDPAKRIWKALPSGLAIIAKFNSAEAALPSLYKYFVSCGKSYEKTSELMTGVSGELLTQCNRVFGRSQMSIKQIINALDHNQSLEPEAVGPVIIDKMSDPGA